jgi:hypothetical protein
MGSNLARIDELAWFCLITVLSEPSTKDGDFIYGDYKKS